MRGDCISRFFQRLSPLLAQHMGMFSGAPSTRFALNGRQQKSHQLRRSQVKAWSRHCGWWLFSSPVAQLLDLSKQKKLRKEKLKIEHHQRMRKVQRLIGAWERVVWKRGVVKVAQDSFGTAWQSMVHGAKHLMPSAYDQHKETSLDVTWLFMLAAGSGKENWRTVSVSLSSNCLAWKTTGLIGFSNLVFQNCRSFDFGCVQKRRKKQQHAIFLYFPIFS